MKRTASLRNCSNYIHIHWNYFNKRTESDYFPLEISLIGVLAKYYEVNRSAMNILGWQLCIIKLETGLPINRLYTSEEHLMHNKMMFISKFPNSHLNLPHQTEPEAAVPPSPSILVNSWSSFGVNLWLIAGEAVPHSVVWWVQAECALIHKCKEAKMDSHCQERCGEWTGIISCHFAG